MRKMVLLLAVLVPGVGCGNPPEPLELLDRALIAHGGLDKLQKPRKGHVKFICKHDHGQLEGQLTFDSGKRYRLVQNGVMPDKSWRKKHPYK